MRITGIYANAQQSHYTKRKARNINIIILFFKPLKKSFHLVMNQGSIFLATSLKIILPFLQFAGMQNPISWIHSDVC